MHAKCTRADAARCARKFRAADDARQVDGGQLRRVARAAQKSQVDGPQLRRAKSSATASAGYKAQICGWRSLAPASP